MYKDNFHMHKRDTNCTVDHEPLTGSPSVGVQLDTDATAGEGRDSSGVLTHAM